MNFLLLGSIIAAPVLIFVMVKYSGMQQSKQASRQRRLDSQRKHKQIMQESRENEREEKRQKAEAGHLQAQLSLASDLEFIDPDGAIEWYKAAAEQDSDIAFHALVRLYDENFDDPNAKDKSLYWHARICAKKGDQESIYRLGRMYIEARGCEINTDLGIETITGVAEAGYMDAQIYLSNWYRSHQDKEFQTKAFYWTLKAAQQDDPKSMLALGKCYRKGTGVAPSPSKAIYWCERVAELKVAEAQYAAAVVNKGISASNNAIAYIWAYLAVSNGLAIANELRNELEQELPLENLLSIQNVARKLVMLMKDKEVKKHSVIKLLNKFYVRDGYFPSQNLEAEAGFVIDDLVESTPPSAEAPVNS